jgi:hypothetical protein
MLGCSWSQLVTPYRERRAKQRRDVAHAAPVALKQSIQGANKEQVIAAINDLLEKLQK